MIEIGCMTENFSAQEPSTDTNATALDGIAIVGIGCRLPGGIDTPDDFWSFLASSQSAISEVPGSRWKLDNHYHPDPSNPYTQHVKYGGFLAGIDQFDASFFGISPREAICMDPQQRMLMEVAWRAMEDAGYPQEAIRNQDVGVFIGISSNDYGSLLWASEEEWATPHNEPYVLPGNTGCIAANRLSYFFDLKGPSLTVDTACSSSLVAVHLACKSLRSGESSMAFVGGVQALIHPGIQTTFCKAGLLSPDGRCKSFDAKANGYVRSEGAGMVLLKPYAKALKDGDRIYALIRGTAVNSDGRSDGMVAPNVDAQIACVRKAFASAGIDPARTQYVEAHGTGTRQGDPIELRALGTVFGEGRSESSPCHVGSVKTNLGHSETAAGITGLIKTALCIKRRQIPPSLNFETPNPSIDFKGLKLKVQTELTPFPLPEHELIAGVSSFGFGGTNAHAVLSESDPCGPTPARYSNQPNLYLLTLSARTDHALSALATGYLQLLDQQPSLSIKDLCASTNLQRTSFRERAVCIAKDRAELSQQLQVLSQGRTPLPPEIRRGLASRRPGKIAWLFTGQGSQSPGMARELLQEHPSFRRAFERVSAMLDPHLDLPLRTLIEPNHGSGNKATSPLDSTGYTQPVLFAVGYAISQLWLEWGVSPDLLLGHSIGEVLAAHLAGVFSLEDACQLVIARSQLMQALPTNGGMAAILCAHERLAPWLKTEPEVAIAAYNTPDNSVVSGPLESIQRVVAKAQAAGIDVRELRVSHAFHSPAMAPMLASFEKELGKISFSAPTKILISNLTGKVAGSEIAHPEYWCEHVINPVRFEQGIHCVNALGAQVFLEIGARPTLIGLARQCLEDPALTFLPSLVPGQSDCKTLFTTLGQLYVSGYSSDWQSFHQPYEHQFVSLPGYPFERHKFWWASKGTISGASLWTDHIGLGNVASKTDFAAISEPKAGAGPEYSRQLKLLDIPSLERHYKRTITMDQPSDLTDHRIRETVIFPAAGFIDQCCDVLSQEKLPLRLINLALARPLKLSNQPVSLLFKLDPDPAADTTFLRFFSNSEAAVDCNWVCHGQAQLPAHGDALESPPFAPGLPPSELTPIDLEGFYAALECFGLCYGPTFRGLKQLVSSGEMAWADLERPSGGSDRGLLDSCFQAVAALLGPTSTAGQFLLPVGLVAMDLQSLPLPDHFSCQVRLRSSSEPAFVICDLVLHTGSTILGWIEGFRLRRMPRQALEWLFPIHEEFTQIEEPASWLIHRDWLDLAAAKETALLPLKPVQDQLSLLGRPIASAPELAAWCVSQNLQIHEIGLDHVVPDSAGDVLIWPILGSICSSEAIVELCSQILLQIQQITSGRVRPIWLLLDGAGAAQGALESLLKTAALEYPQYCWTQLHLPEPICEHPTASAWGEIWAGARIEASLRWYGGRLQVPRLRRLATLDRFRLSTRACGSLEDLVWQSLPQQQPRPGEVEVAVEATGLNFRDVLNALGLLSTYSAQLGIDADAKIPFGGECVGRVIAIGPGVDPALLGERVLAALAVGSLASHVLCRSELCVVLPSTITPELGASISTVFLTALYGLETLADLQVGETVLIHAAAGGVGQAAVQVARSRGARIFATASQAKHAALLEQGVEAVFDSRSLDFADAVLQSTQGRGVDVVLNSLKGEWVDAGFRALAQGGRFVELGKIEIWSGEEARKRRPDARYLPFDLLEVAVADPQLIRNLLIRLLKDLGQGVLVPIPLKVFTIDQTVDAFRWIAQAKHVGKVVIVQPLRPEPLVIRAEGTYLVTGAFGGLGLQLLEWLAAQGATSLLAIARGANEPPETARQVLARLADAGVECHCLAVDLAAVSEEETAAASALAQAQAALPQNKPLLGVFHAAGILDDGLIASQTQERMHRVISPKFGGWEILHRALIGNHFYVSFSSMAALLGSPGQVSYSAANGALDGDCLARSLEPECPDGLHLSIQWGPWAGAGMAASLSDRDRKRFEAFGVGLLEPAQAFKALEIALLRGIGGQLAVVNNNWQRISEQSPTRQARALEDLLNAHQTSEGDDTAETRQILLDKIAQSPEIEHHALVVGLLQANLARVMGLSDPSFLDPGESLFHIGLDSLMAVELAATIQRDLGVSLELESLAGDPTLDGLGHYVLAALIDPLARQRKYLDLGQEAILPSDWKVIPGDCLSDMPGEEILLTGASGFLGAYLLASQLQRWPDLCVRCLVRAADASQGLERIRSNMVHYGIWNMEWESRIIAIPGDLAKPGFGMEADKYTALGTGIGGIIHNGAYLSQMATYSQLAPTNVEGTRRILQIAFDHGGIPVQMISSVAIFEGAAYRDKEIFETDEIRSWEGIFNGYSQTKWVSDRLVVQAGLKGLPVTIYRPPLIGGHSQTGAWHQDDLLYRLLKGCLQLGMAPDVSWELDLVPIDYVADAVTALAWRPESQGQCFHLQHPKPHSLRDLLGGLTNKATPVQRVSMQQWLSAIEKDPSNPLHEMRGFFTRRWGAEQLTYPELNQIGQKSRPSSALTVAALDELGVRCPTYEKLFVTYGAALLQ